MNKNGQAERADFLDEALIANILEKAKNASIEEARAIIEKGREAKGLDPYETAVLLHAADGDAQAALFEAAREVKEKIYGKRIIFFNNCSCFLNVFIYYNSHFSKFIFCFISSLVVGKNLFGLLILLIFLL